MVTSRLPRSIRAWICAGTSNMAGAAIGGVVKPLVFVLLLAPFGYGVLQVALIVAGQPHELGADPAKALVLFTGEWSIRLILAGLAVSTLARVTGYTQVMRFRRMVGLFAFFYVTVHLSSYLGFLLGLRFDELIADVIKRPYITVGFLAWLMLVPLAATSNRFMVRKLGRRWRILHRLVYPVSVLCVLHFLWQARADIGEPIVYGAVLAGLLGERGYRTLVSRRPISKVAAAAH
ncbi:MAG: sulfoxide reductase heme-binding subunit YedZ [Gammaproteobacteria bacterium]|nr:sulfoxide reductase heme-binding subunit YedZ [Gammaproteobacteria bacterium]